MNDFFWWFSTENDENVLIFELKIIIYLCIMFLSLSPFHSLRCLLSVCCVNEFLLLLLFRLNVQREYSRAQKEALLSVYNKLFLLISDSVAFFFSLPSLINQFAAFLKGSKNSMLSWESVNLQKIIGYICYLYRVPFFSSFFMWCCSKFTLFPAFAVSMLIII